MKVYIFDDSFYRPISENTYTLSTKYIDRWTIERNDYLYAISIIDTFSQNVDGRLCENKKIIASKGNSSSSFCLVLT